MANIKISELNPLLTVEDADVLPIVDNAVTKKVTAAILRSYTQGNSVLLTGNQTVAGIKTFTSQLASSVATGTAPFSVASTTKVTNLNADLLDGLSSADFQATLSGTGIVKSTAGTISYLTDNSTNWNTAFNDKINSAAVTGSGTNTLTLTQQDAGTITATWVNGTLIREIRNNTGATLTKGTIVYISGATGNKPTVSKAIATGDSTSAQTFGFVQENILNNANGYVVVIGDLTGVDTSAFTEGDQLYLSATVAGAFTATKQYAPNHLVYVGIVTRSHPTLGQIEVNIQNGYELDELHNVAAQSPSNGDILQYVTSTGLWTKIGGTTSAISEGSNLYFTNARSRSAISLTTTGTSGAATYNSTTGVLNVPNYADTDTGITSLNGLTALTQTFAVGTSGTDFGISSATSTHTFNLPTASAANRGALSSTDWTTFNNKQNALTNPITGTGTTNYLPKFTGASALGDSIISESGTIITIAGSSRFTGFDSGYYNENVLAIGNGTYNPKIGLSSINGYRWNTRIKDVGGNGEYVIRYEEGSLDALVINRSGAATFSASVTAVATGIQPLIYAKGGGDVSGMGKGNFRTSDLGGSNYWDFGRDNLTTGDFVITEYGGSPILRLKSSTGEATFSSSVTTGADATINGVTVGKGAGSVAGNSAVGLDALSSNSSGSNVTAFGYFALRNNSTGGSNTAVGRTSLAINTTGSANSAFGSQCLESNITGDSNTAYGFASLNSTNGSNNTAVGALALLSNTASNNTAVGFEAGFSNTTGAEITALGYRALKANTTGASNTAVGLLSLNSNTTGVTNSAFGAYSLPNNTTGGYNTSIGQQSLYSNVTGSNNTAVGQNALFLNTASNNTAVGFESAFSNTSGIITAIGYQALRANTTGDFNTTIGFESLKNNTTGSSNSALGAYCLISNTTGSNNTGLGFQSGYSITTGANNTVIGKDSLSANSTGSNNSALGINTQSGNFSGSVILGAEAIATANNQFVVGSATTNAGAVTTEVLVSDTSWAVRINGTAYKILLKA